MKAKPWKFFKRTKNKYDQIALIERKTSSMDILEDYIGLWKKVFKLEDIAI